MSEGQSRVEAERAKAMDAAHVYVRTGSWQAWLDLVVAAAVVGWPLSRGNSVVLVLLAVGILAAFAAWRWLADAEVSFDADGVRITDRYWQLLRREPIHFGYAEGIQIVAQSGLSFGVVWVNDLRIAAGSGAAFRLEKVARNMGLRFIRVETSIATAAPTVLMLAAISSFFLVHGLMGWLLYYGLYGSGLLAVLIPFLGGHRAWEAIAARRGCAREAWRR